MEISQSTRLFLPLTSQAFEWYSLDKNVEVRKFRGRFKTVMKRDYKFAELRKGYSGESKFASIKEIILFENSRTLFDKVDYKRVIPIATSRQDAEKIVHEYVGNEQLLAIFLSVGPKLEFDCDIMRC